MLNPKLFLELAPLLRRYRVEFRVPMELKELCFSGEVLVVDTESLDFIKRSGVSVDACREVIVADSVEEVRSTVLSRVFKGRGPISIGIDLGKRIAYAVLAGGDVLSYGYIDSLKSVLEVVKRLGVTEPKIVLVGIGAEYLRD
ncbi:MAG: hypothetical protein NZ925_05440, partial [Sulfolobales archaeon]|nr:hypothetical protein [Sulfolobales archaeon]